MSTRSPKNTRSTSWRWNSPRVVQRNDRLRFRYRVAIDREGIGSEIPSEVDDHWWLAPVTKKQELLTGGSLLV